MRPTTVDSSEILEVCRKEVMEWDKEVVHVAHVLYGLLSEGLGLGAERLTEMGLLEKHCEIGEIKSVSSGRYVVMVEDSERKQCSNSNEKKKREKMRSKHGEGKSVEEKSEERWLQMFGKQSHQHVEAKAEAEAQCGLGESQIQVL
ncbi:hypothetical protein JHK87_022139 [Glycine soja]|nr:hypothetical protein JHK87_022139 [Glycine soja]